MSTQRLVMLGKIGNGDVSITAERPPWNIPPVPLPEKAVSEHLRDILIMHAALLDKPQIGAMRAAIDMAVEYEDVPRSGPMLYRQGHAPVRVEYRP